jgi:hypothetical protein
MTRLVTPSLLLLLAFGLLSLSGCVREASSVDGSGAALEGRPYFATWQTGDKHYFHLRAGNHEIILGSQPYASRTAALNGVLSVLDNGEAKGAYAVKPSSNGQWYFNLVAANGRVIGTSELYTTSSSAARGAETVRANVGHYLDFLAERTGARFDVFAGVDGKFYFNLHAKNGEVVLSSQGYADEATALNATFSVVDHGVDPARFAVTQARDGSYYFNLVAANGRVLGTSEMYATESNAKRARDAIVELLPEIDLL